MDDSCCFYSGSKGGDGQWTLHVSNPTLVSLQNEVGCFFLFTQIQVVFLQPHENNVYQHSLKNHKEMLLVLLLDDNVISNDSHKRRQIPVFNILDI